MRLATVLLLLCALVPFTPGCGNKKADDKKEEKDKPKERTIEEKGKDFISGANDIATKNKEDCDKFGTELEKYVKDNKSTIKEVFAHREKLSEDEKKKFDEATGGKKNDDPMDQSMKKCAGNANVEKAMTAMFEAADMGKDKKDKKDKKEEKKDDEKKPD